MNMMLTGATAENLRRKAAYADAVQMRGGVPVFSWIDVSVTELCNRSAGSPKACVFCPRIDPAKFPNQPLNMPVGLAQKIGDELREMDYGGAIALCGYGEPLLHPRIVDIVEALSGLHVEIVTNGDRLSYDLIRALIEAGTKYFIVSCYDGPHQLPLIDALFREAGYGAEYYTKRDRWHGPEQEYGLKLTNRAGMITSGPQPPVDPTHACFYPSYQLSIDWQGDVLLCVQDWNRRVKFGNVNTQTLWSAWTSKAMHKRRMALINGHRCDAPCNGCNCEGTAHGAGHAKAWSR